MDPGTILFSLAILGAITVALYIKSREGDASVPGSTKKETKTTSATGTASDLAESMSDTELEAQVRSLVDSHKFIEAIKLIRQHKQSIGLKEAKEIVDELARSGELKLPHNRVFSDAPVQGPERVLDLLRQGNKIMAIKELRDQTGMGLKEAKDEVDRLERELR